MFAYSLILMILLCVTLLSSTLEIFCSPEEMNDMGIRIEPQASQI